MDHRAWPYVDEIHDTLQFHALFERRAAETPTKTALLIDGRAWSYAELETTACRVANWLSRHDIPAGAHISVRFSISLEAVAAVLGILKAGCVIVTNHPAFSGDKLTHQITASGSQALITDDGSALALAFSKTSIRAGLLIGNIGRLSVESTSAETFSDVEAERATFEPTFIPDRKRRAAIFYTSGSTFAPKGVVINHGNMLAAFESITSYLQSSPNDTILHYSNFGFDFGIYNTIMPLSFGGSVVAGSKIPDDPNDILEIIRSGQVTALHFMPPVIYQLCKADDVIFGPSSAVRYISSTGQAFAPKYIHKLREANPDVDVLSMYGMNEATRVLYLPPSEIDRRPTSVGKAIPGVRTYLVGANGEQILQSGVVGELAVAGDLVMEGYWQSPDENREAFRHDVYGEKRVFLTGDMFKMDDEGFLYYVSRKDDVFTRSMFQVNPKEIEAHLLSFEGVAEAVVVPVPETGVGFVPKAYVVLDRQGWHITPDALLEFCKAKLDWHMIPSEIELLESLPRTPSGKTQIRNLGAVTTPSVPLPAAAVPSEDTAMRRLASQFDDLATGRRQVPHTAVRTEMAAITDDVSLSRYHDLLISRTGPLFKHFLASVPYVLEELCRTGTAIEEVRQRRSDSDDRPYYFFEADAFDGSNGRTLNRYSERCISTLTNSPNPSNEQFFRLHNDAENASFFSGTFLEVARAQLGHSRDLERFRDGFDFIYETATLQFYGKGRQKHIDHIADLLRPDGLAIFMHKLGQSSVDEFLDRERLKDEVFKAKYFTAEEVAWKRQQMLDQMHTGLITLEETKKCIKKTFRYGALIWNSGNFHSVLASNSSDTFEEYLETLSAPIIPAEYCVERLRIW